MAKPIGNMSFNLPHKDKVSQKTLDRFGPQLPAKPEAKPEDASKPRYKTRKKK